MIAFLPETKMKCQLANLPLSVEMIAFRNSSVGHADNLIENGNVPIGENLDV
jgi:hypothetical protein